MKYLGNFTNHLEFLGYQINNLEDQPDRSYIMALARHSQRDNIFLLADRQIALLFLQMRWNFRKKVSSVMYEYIDEVHGAVNISRAYIDEDESQLILQTHWTGDYNKNLFGEFINMFYADRQTLVSFPGFEKIWT